MLRQTFLAYLISQLEMYLASCGLDGQHQLEMPSHIEEPKNSNSEMLSLINKNHTDKKLSIKELGPNRNSGESQMRGCGPEAI